MRRDSGRIADELLVLRAQAQDAWAFEQLHQRFRIRLLGHARTLTGRLDAAEDVSQEVWIAIARGLRRLVDPSLFRAWAYRITTYKATDWLRQETRREALTQVARDNVPDERATSAAADSEPADQLRRALASLAPEHRAVVRLHYLDQLSVAEIAAAMQIPVGTVKSRLFHSRKQLERALGQPAEKGPDHGRN